MAYRTLQMSFIASGRAQSTPSRESWQGRKLRAPHRHRESREGGGQRQEGTTGAHASGQRFASQELVWRVLKARMVARQMKQETEAEPPP